MPTGADAERRKKIRHDSGPVIRGSGAAPPLTHGRSLRPRNPPAVTEQPSDNEE